MGESISGLSIRVEIVLHGCFAWLFCRVPVDLLTLFELDKVLKELQTLKNISFAV